MADSDSRPLGTGDPSSGDGDAHSGVGARISGAPLAAGKAADGFAALPRLYRVAFHGAASRARRHGWTCLSKAEYLDVVARAAGRCELTGHAFENRAFVVPWRGRRPFNSFPWAPSLDRRDIERGYELENVRLVCASVNGALSYLPEEVFAEMCRAFVAKHGQ